MTSERFVPFGRETWDISQCLDGDGLPRLKRRIVCPACGADMEHLWWKEWRVFSRDTVYGRQYRMDIAVKCGRCALVTGQDRVCITHNDLAFGVHLTEEEYERFVAKKRMFFDYNMYGSKVSLEEIYVGGD